MLRFGRLFTKDQSEPRRIPGKFDAKGAGVITDMVENVFIVWRNKKAERGNNADQKPTAMLRCDKQCTGEWEGLLGFWFHPESMQYLERTDVVPVHYSLC